MGAERGILVPSTDVDSARRIGFVVREFDRGASIVAGTALDLEELGRDLGFVDCLLSLSEAELAC